MNFISILAQSVKKNSLTLRYCILVLVTNVTNILETTLIIYFPVEPKPPAPLSVSSKSSTQSTVKL
jgi:hypothetical protein